jgi:pantoate--beta-alanine ligase
MRLEMIIARSVEELRVARDGLDGTVGFVPTMGALHDGHLSLIRKSVDENNYTIASIFVNPTQFLEGEDLDSYPSRLDADREICRLAKVDILFMPTVDQMYGADELSIGAPAVRGYILEGAKRPGHFDGMLQIVMKLLNLVSPTRAYFGKKDAQQLALISQMVRDYFMSVEIVPCDIVREPSGLAMSSRNLYLSDEQKSRALSISRSLQKATHMIIAGEIATKEIISKMNIILTEVDSIEYISIVDRSFGEISEVEIGDTIILVAVWVGETRLIDNIWI